MTASATEAVPAKEMTRASGTAVVDVADAALPLPTENNVETRTSVS